MTLTLGWRPLNQVSRKSLGDNLKIWRRTFLFRSRATRFETTPLYPYCLDALAKPY